MIVNFVFHETGPMVVQIIVRIITTEGMDLAEQTGNVRDIKNVALTATGHEFANIQQTMDVKNRFSVKLKYKKYQSVNICQHLL